MKEIMLLIMLLFNLSIKAQHDAVDTLRVSELDTTLFIKKDRVIRHYSPLPDFLRPKPRPEYLRKFEIQDAYYIISNTKERTVTEQLCIKGICDTIKLSWYAKSGKLLGVRYYEKRGSRIENLTRKGIPKKISYFDEKGDLKKIEFYSRDKLKKIRSYTHFNTYTTEYIK